MDTSSEQLLIFHIREARSKAVEAAKFEAMSVLKNLTPETLKGGPLSEKGGVFWLRTRAPVSVLKEVNYWRLGYSVATDLVVPISESNYRQKRPDMTRFRGKAIKLERLYELDVATERERNPDQRLFHLATPEGEVREVHGYRGDGSQLGRRALPVCDAQILVNIVDPGPGKTLLDPFGGGGGIIQEAVRARLVPQSVDIDPILAPGLERMGARHHVGNAVDLPFAYESVDAIATEPPFDRESRDWIAQAFDEMLRVLKVGGRLAVYCAEWQAEPLRIQGGLSPLKQLLDLPIDRKGYPCHLLAWEKTDW